jgi:hypothetical protein
LRLGALTILLLMGGSPLPMDGADGRRQKHCRLKRTQARDYLRQVTGIMESHVNDRSPAVASALVNEAVVEQRAHNLEDAVGKTVQP